MLQRAIDLGVDQEKLLLFYNKLLRCPQRLPRHYQITAEDVLNDKDIRGIRSEYGLDPDSAHNQPR